MDNVFYQLPIYQPPVVQIMGIGVHGHEPHERFLIPDLWCVHFFRDPLELKLDEDRFSVQSGDVVFMPPGISIEYFFPQPIRHIHLHTMFKAPNSTETVSVSAVQNLGSDFERWYHAMEEAMSWHQTQTIRTSARLWEVLWFLAQRQMETTSQTLISRAYEIIESRLHEPLSVAQLARELEVSHNHLTRSFRATTGTTVVDAIRQRRVERAEHLLRHTTLPVKAIASQCGLGDFHSLNKALRRVLGHGPRAIRDGKENDAP